MGPSEKTFNQVKSILGKLDRSIDQLRAQRTVPPTPAPVDAARNQPAAVPAMPQPARPTSMYGRATPLR
ncbi:MAG: hypothetical protein IT433_13180 [Phycisphaerales bacterium]|nr:hypothetical protein [Phycisphaerales bacterium]